MKMQKRPALGVEYPGPLLDQAGSRPEVHQQVTERLEGAPIEMFEALLSLDPRLSAKQKHKRFDKIMATAFERLQRKDA